jgi:hypothetical protein
MPRLLTARSTSIAAPSCSSGSGGGPAVPAELGEVGGAEVRAQALDAGAGDRQLDASTLAQNLTVCPAQAGPSQNCRCAIKFAEGGTTRSNTIAPDSSASAPRRRRRPARRSRCAPARQLSTARPAARAAAARAAPRPRPGRRELPITAAVFVINRDTGVKHQPGQDSPALTPKLSSLSTTSKAATFGRRRRPLRAAAGGRPRHGAHEPGPSLEAFSASRRHSHAARTDSSTAAQRQGTPLRGSLRSALSGCPDAGRRLRSSAGRSDARTPPRGRPPPLSSTPSQLTDRIRQCFREPSAQPASACTSPATTRWRHAHNPRR